VYEGVTTAGVGAAAVRYDHPIDVTPARLTALTHRVEIDGRLTDPWLATGLADDVRYGIDDVRFGITALAALVDPTAGPGR
jgi:hypothetical protein